MAGVVRARRDLVDEHVTVLRLEQLDPVDAAPVEELENVSRDSGSTVENRVVGTGG